ncbi:MAG: T9SS type A sorting domain-containing protein [Flavobacteriales bacterium]|nr:T9SS type A sorting domain-containing protein [Flavobacteriales bacterium]
MFRYLLLVFTWQLALSLYAQDHGFSCDVQYNLKSVRLASVNWSELPDDSAGYKAQPFLAPEPGSSASGIKRQIDAGRQRRFTAKTLDKYIQTPENIRPVLEADYNGLPIGGAGIPNDNNMAISNDGFVVSVVNSIVTMFDKDGNHIGFKSLNAFVKGALPNLDRTYDPKVTYDPQANKFILVFLQGSLSADTRIIVGFSESSDPTQDWNFYAINGNPFGGAYWSDYPIIGISESDLFITVNILRDNGSWQDDFIQSLIWQVDKESGFSGSDTLYQNVFSNIKYNGKSIWSICAVQEYPTPGKDEMYFLSVRPGDLSNDTVFLHQIRGAQRSNNSKYYLEVMKTPLKYGVPPTAYQPRVGFRLQTNDARVLSALKVGTHMQYVQTTSIPGSDPSGIYHGTIDLIKREISAHYIFSDTLDYAYPSIAFSGYANTTASEYGSVITFSHTSELDFPGTSAVFHNRLPGNPPLYSPVIRIKEGEGIINTFVADTAERWGDYTGIQPKYDEPGVVWMAGSYGMDRERNGVWIGKVRVNTLLEPELDSESVIAYPNPLSERVSIRVSLKKSTEVIVELHDASGRLTKELFEGMMPSGSGEFYFHKGGMRSGLYFLTLRNANDRSVLDTYRVMIPD